WLRRIRAIPCTVNARLVEALRQASRPAPGIDDAPDVALFTARLSPGGAEKSALDLATALVAQGHAVHLFTTLGSDNVWSARARSAGVRVVHLPEFLPRGCWLAYLCLYFERAAVAVLHISNSHWMYENVHALKRQLPSLRVVSQLHAEGRPGTRDYLSLAADADDVIDRHSVISAFLRGRLIAREHIDAAKVTVVRTGIDVVKEFDGQSYGRGDWRQRYGMPPDARLVVFVGRFSDIKRPLCFLDVAQLVLDRLPATRFVMKGEGPLLATIERRLASQPVLASAVLIEDASAPVQPLMVDADLLLLTSAMEGIAYVSYEAMALGLVQISTAVGGQAELIADDCGRLIMPGEGEVQHFTDAVVELLADDQRRRAMSAAAQRRIQVWPDIDDMAAAYRQLYHELVVATESECARNAADSAWHTGIGG
ncbi:MAG: glycosyltransferase family 4 protein, partial [Gammaproteobacteria bacterium]|nr:glycosyltransferase family 4 protein [Gammaproteobacteria bacterium]